MRMVGANSEIALIILSKQLELTYDEGSVASGVRSVEVHVLISNKNAIIVTRDT